MLYLNVYYHIRERHQMGSSAIFDPWMGHTKNYKTSMTTCLQLTEMRSIDHKRDSMSDWRDMHTAVE